MASHGPCRVGLWPALLAVLPLLAQLDPAVAARHSLDLLLAGQHASFHSLLSPAAKEKLTPEFLRDHVGKEIAGFGQVKEIGKPVTLKAGANQLFSFPVRFSQATINVQLTMNEAGQVAGLFFRPSEEPLPAVWKRPPYSHPDSFRETEVTIGSGEWKLGGTLTVPVGKGPFPAVVLVHGAGPNDRNEAVFATRMFQDIAEGLASKGILVLRYDKRTRVYSEKMGWLPYTVREETTEDAVRAVVLVRQLPQADPAALFVLGHSLGGYLLPRIPTQDGKLAGAIVLAGNARRIEDVSLAQTEFMLQAKGGPTSEERKRLDEMKAQADQVKKLQPGKNNPQILLGLPVEYFLDLRAYDPVAEAKRSGIPMLFLQGQRDFQITMQDFNIWRSSLAGNRYTFHTFPDLNHLFIAGEGDPSPVEYRKPGNVAPQVIDTIAEWIAAGKH